MKGPEKLQLVRVPSRRLVRSQLSLWGVIRRDFKLFRDGHEQSCLEMQTTLDICQPCSSRHSRLKLLSRVRGTAPKSLSYGKVLSAKFDGCE